MYTLPPLPPFASRPVSLEPRASDGHALAGSDNELCDGASASLASGTVARAARPWRRPLDEDSISLCGVTGERGWGREEERGGTGGSGQRAIPLRMTSVDDGEDGRA